MEKKFEVDAQTFIGGWYMSEEICDQILDLYNNNKSLHEPGVVGTDIINEDGKVTSRPHIDAEAKKCTQLRVLKNAQQLSLYNIHLQAILDSYKQKYEWADQVKYYKIVEDMSIQHYKPGEGFYRWHMENTGHGFTINRHLVFMTYLNDVKEADGGSTFFCHYDLEVQPKKGLTLIWPAEWTHAHKGNVLKFGNKYIITGWMNFSDNR